jgi:hypothetical protein
MQERRTHRSEKLSEALGLQLEACGTRGNLEAIVVVDRDGLEVCGWGQPGTRANVVGRAVLAGRHTAHFEGEVSDGDRQWSVETARIRPRGTELFVCAVGGSDAERTRQLGRCALGAVRILTA